MRIISKTFFLSPLKVLKREKEKKKKKREGLFQADPQKVIFFFIINKHHCSFPFLFQKKIFISIFIYY